MRSSSGSPGRGDGIFGRRQHLRRELVRHLELGPDGGQAVGQLGGELLGQADFAGGHQIPELAVRTRIRLHSSQRSTSSTGAAAKLRSSAAFTSSWQPVHRRARSSAAPTPPWLAATRS